MLRGDETIEFSDRLPLLPLRDVVVFPYMTIPLLVGRFLAELRRTQRRSHRQPFAHSPVELFH